MNDINRLHAVKNKAHVYYSHSIVNVSLQLWCQKNKERQTLKVMPMIQQRGSVLEHNKE